MFTKTQLEIMAEMMEILSHQLGNNGCNDFELENTEENMVFCQEMENAIGEDGDEFSVSKNGKLICLTDFRVADYCEFLFREEIERINNK